MKKVLRPKFVEFIPKTLEDDTIYISQTYATVVHKCCCGCGNKVVTPLSPTGWRLTINGKYVSLYPSIGNWSFPCRSHYWIRRNRVVWSYQMSQQEILVGRLRDSRLKDQYFSTGAPKEKPDYETDLSRSRKQVAKPSIWEKLKRWFFN